MNPPDTWRCKRCDLEFSSSQTSCLVCGTFWAIAAYRTSLLASNAQSRPSPDRASASLAHIMSPLSPRSAGSTSQVLTKSDATTVNRNSIARHGGLNSEEKQKLETMMDSATNAIRSLSPERDREIRAKEYDAIPEAGEPKYTKYRSTRPGGDVIVIRNDFFPPMTSTVDSTPPAIDNGRRRQGSTCISTSSGLPSAAPTSPPESNLEATINSIKSHTSSIAPHLGGDSQHQSSVSEVLDLLPAPAELRQVLEDGHTPTSKAELGGSHSMDQAMRLLIERIETLEVENGHLKEELNSTKVKLSLSLSREADSAVSNELANDCIRDLQAHLRLEKARMDVPKIVADEFELRCWDLLEERDHVLDGVRKLMEDHQRLLVELAEKKQIDVIAVDAAVQKNATVVKLKDDLTTMELKVHAAEALARIRSAEASKFEEELQNLTAKTETAEIIWQQKEAAWRREKLQLERDLRVFRNPNPVVSEERSSDATS